MQREPHWLTALKRQGSAFLSCVDSHRVEEATRVADELTRRNDEFSSNPSEGRGTPYRQAQINMSVRSTGIHGLLSKFDFEPEMDGQVQIIVDLLGGDGLIARLLRGRRNGQYRDAVLTSDVSDDMVRAAIRHGLPAIRQAAQYLALREESFDGVLLAYGTHHIPPLARGLACAEAFRILKSGGQLVLHDFPSGSPVARWFSDVVHRYSKTGHDHEHFDAGALRALFAYAAFGDTTVTMLYDPFVVTAPTPDLARTALGEYLLDMYGLELLSEEMGRKAAIAHAFELAHDCFRYDYGVLGLPCDFGASTSVAVSTSSGVRLECPRVAIVATGVKP